LKTIAKVGIGCGVALLLALTAGIAIFIGGAFWVKGKVEKVAGDEKKIEALKQQAAQAAPFTRPVDGSIQEARLVKFIEIRKAVFVIYEKHKAEIESMGKRDKANMSDVMTAFSWIAEIRRTQAEAQAAVGMGDDEYRFLVEQVYKSAWAAEIAKSSGGKTPSEATGQAMEQMSQALKQAEAQMKDATPEQKQQMKDAIAEAQDQAASAEKSAQALDVPKGNIELFRKYEADIKKYSMNGLELLSL